MNNAPYNIVHIIGSGEYRAPLLATQVFDRAQVQASTEGVNKPASVSVWIMVPMRELFDKECTAIVDRMKARCPNVSIKMVGGISRLNQWPTVPTLKRLRAALGSRTVYHCRGEHMTLWARMLKQRYKDDAVVLDMRGYRPLELYVNEEIYDEKDMNEAQRANYHANIAFVTDIINQSDAVCTVSEPLRQYIIEHVNAPKDTALIPCCVTKTIPGTHREEIRKELNLGNKTAILYLGGTQRYQHLEDLVIPFLKAATDMSEDNVAVFITQNKGKMLKLIRQFGVNEERIRLLSAPQDEVGKYLSAMNMGLLLRSPNALNNFSQPVKFGEYLSAGLPVILEEGTGNIAKMLAEHKIGCVVKLTGKTDKDDFDNEIMKALNWEKQNRAQVQANTRKFVEDHYTWTANLKQEREMYIKAFATANARKTAPK